MIRLLLVDDHPVVLDGLEAALASHGEVEVVDRAASLAGAQQALMGTQVDIALCDVRLPDGTGFELLEWGQSLARPPAFLMLTTFTSAQYVSTAMRLGARGYLLKTSPIDQIVDSIRRVAGGGVAFITDGGLPDTEGVPELTPREQQIVTLCAHGRTNKEVGAALGISPKTVEWHLARLFLKLRIESRTQLVASAQRAGLI